MKRTIHIVIRTSTYSDMEKLERFSGDPVEEHNRISFRNTVAFFGKIGRKPSDKILNLAIESISDRKKTKLILARKNKGEFEVFCAPIRNIYTDNFSPKRSLIPAYYRDLASSISLWFEIGSFVPMSQTDMNRLILLATEKPLLETLLTCRTPLLLVREK